MDLLGGYSDDEENEEHDTASASVSASGSHANKPEQKIQNPKPNPSGPKQKKKKKLDISFLPENIQAALARGDTANDSDSDQEGIALPKPVANSEQTSMSVLLSKLPKPKARNSANSQPIPTTQIHSAKVILSPPIEPTKVIEVIQEKVLGDVHIDSDDSDTYDYAIPESFSTVPSSIGTSSSNLHSPIYSDNPFSEPPVLLPSLNPQAFYPSSQSSSFSSTFDSFHSTNPLPASSAVAMFPTDSNAVITSAPSTSYSTNKKSFRKRDREIESSLMRGDITAANEIIQGDGNEGYDRSGAGKIMDIQHNHEWNSDDYYTQQKRQKELQSIFNFKQNGGDKMLSQPTKLQNKRHQINSLVMSAAESELELLEAKGRQLKTKYETQSKYGW